MNVTKLDFNFSQSQHILRSRPGRNELINNGLATIGSSNSKTCSHHVAETISVTSRILDSTATVIREIGNIHVTSVKTSHLTAHSKPRGNSHLASLQELLGHGVRSKGNLGNIQLDTCSSSSWGPLSNSSSKVGNC